MAVTIKQIAELANVSRGTVDKVLNQRPGVKKETRQRVLQIADGLNYKPNFIGKALVQSKNPIKIGIILTPDYNPFIKEMLQGIQNAQSEFNMFGIEVCIKMPISLEPAEQIVILDELEKDKVSGIAVFPIDDESVRNKINQLIDNGIPIITFNSRLKGTNELCFIGQDHKKGGRTAAGLICKLLPQGGDVGIIISSYNLSCHQDRLQGFLDKIKDSTVPITVLEVKENEDLKEKAFKTTLEYCNQNPNLKGIYITGGGISGVINALDIVGKTRDITIVCHDLVADTLTFLKNGTIDFVIDQNPEFQGYQLVKILFDYLIKGEEPSSQYIEIPITIATQDSL